ncbi:CDP-diacylglycerol-serine O-phosphatidyltransferase [Tilletia horrida]|nr:CDP-diacylglycerol-serine O-phosphatidyltransferase [Tilletia horrida]
MPGTIASITDPALVSAALPHHPTSASASASASQPPRQQPQPQPQPQPSSSASASALEDQVLTTAAQASNVLSTAADPTALAAATASPFNSPPGSRRPSAQFPQIQLSALSEAQPQAPPPKAAIVSAPTTHALVTPEPLQQGVALTSASSANAILHSAISAAIAPTNTPARMTTDLAHGSSNSNNNNMASSSSSSSQLTQRKGAAAAAAASSTRSSSSSPQHAGADSNAANSNLVRFVETPGHFSLVRNFHLADAFTLMNGFCGAQSLFASGRYLITSDPIHAWHALWFPLFGAIFDLLDGKVARWRNSSSMLGQELDSLADSTSFGAAPAFAAFALGLRLPLDTLILTGFVCAGIARLARFNVTTASIPHDSSGKARYFEGLPIPSSLILVGGMALCLLFGRFEGAGGGSSVGLGAITTVGKAGWWAPAQLLTSSPSTAWNLLKAEASLPTGRKLLFTGRLAASKLVSAGGATGVPLGVLNLDVFGLVEGVFGADFAQEWARVHTISLLWLAWSAAMVSKTLRVPKP